MRRTMPAALPFAALLILSTPAQAQDTCSQSNALACYTQALVRLQSAQDALIAARTEITSLRTDIARGTPVGFVAPMFVSVDQIKALAPTWLPADGRTVDDKDSELNGIALPNLTDRVVLGGDPNVSIIETTPSNSSGSLSTSIPFNYSGRTNTLNSSEVTGITGRNQGAPPEFVIDTNGYEVAVAVHFHSFSINTNLSVDIPRQPYRKLIYMVRCRR